MDDSQRKIEHLEQLLLECNQKRDKTLAEWSILYDQVKSLKSAHQSLQEDYESLRLQKGGFGFKMVFMSGLMGTVIALAGSFLYIKFKPKPLHSRVFEQFQRENLFQYELSLSNGEFLKVEQALELQAQKTENLAIKPEINCMQKLVSAAKRHCLNQ